MNRFAATAATARSMPSDSLIIRGAREHNLKNITVAIPHDRVTAITGLSGSGKSSLAFDTIFAEGQWRYIESLSSYARLFLEKVDRPDVEAIEQIRPAIAIEQKNPVRSARSTVGTGTELYDYLRLLFAKIGVLHCPTCGGPVRAESPSMIAERLLTDHPREPALVLFTPAIPHDPAQLLRHLLDRGFFRLRVTGDPEGQRSGDIRQIDAATPPEQLKTMPFAVVVDRLRLVPDEQSRLAESLATALQEGDGQAQIEFPGKELLQLTQAYACAECRTSYRRPQPLLFSFNHPLGACPDCKGFGHLLRYDEKSVVPDPRLTLAQGAVDPWTKPSHRWWQRQLMKHGEAAGIRLDVPYQVLSKKEKKILWGGAKKLEGLDGFFTYLEGKRYKLHVRVFLSRYRSPTLCPRCEGSRLIPLARAVTVHGRTITQLCALSIDQLADWFEQTPFAEHEQAITGEVLRQIRAKLRFLRRVGLGYVTLNRQTRTLSGGEAQRISLANQLGAQLTGTLYVLDEPSIGLHPRDTARLAAIVRDLAASDNTAVIVEHDAALIRSADYVIELGPGSGAQGGQIVFAGDIDAFLKSDSLTARYLSHQTSIPAPAKRRKGNGQTLTLHGAQEHNLKQVTLSLPLQTFICVTGVSGSGKSTLLRNTLYPALARYFRQSFESMGRFERIAGMEQLRGVRLIDQEPIGRTPRSNPVTYMQLFGPIRQRFAEQSAAKERGLSPRHFSFNVAGGRCERCEGNGYQKLEMFFFEDLYVSCEECGGARYRPEVLKVTYKGLHIGQVLELTVDEALRHFADLPETVRTLRLLSDVGLGYIRLGQPATTLSGGEAQRLKICAELDRADAHDWLFLLDEPTTGLHPEDIRKLLAVLQRLVDQGNTVIVIEHNLDVIKCADWIVDMGPEGGDQGGEIIAEGTPETVANNPRSYTGQYLRPLLS
ncbi:MAG: excinuclease ABC subunit UvrA [Nitrospirota bacterium]